MPDSPIRVLHLHDIAPDYQTASGVAALSRDGAGVFAPIVRTVGRGGDYASPARSLMSRPRAGIDFELVHAWGPTALAVAAMGKSRRIVFSPIDTPGRSELRWILALLRYRDLHVVCPTELMRRTLVTNGLPFERCHHIRPGVTASKIRKPPDPELRAALGIAPGDYIMLASGESTRAANHRLAVWAAAILNVLDPKNRLLVWGRGPLVEQVDAFAGRLLKTDTLAIDATKKLKHDIPYEHLLAAADCVLVTSQRPAPTLPLSTAMSAGVPIVATASASTCEVLEDRHTALLVGQPIAREIARRILDLRNDDQTRWAIVDMGRTEAYEFFSLTRFLDQWRQVYRQVNNGGKVEIAEKAPGAGMRFHGRG